jgi:hypothetical protein
MIMLIQVPISWHSETTNVRKTASKDISGFYFKTSNGNRLLRKVSAVATMTSRLDEQSIT